MPYLHLLLCLCPVYSIVEAHRALQSLNGNASFVKHSILATLELSELQTSAQLDDVGSHNDAEVDEYEQSNNRDLSHAELDLYLS